MNLAELNSGPGRTFGPGPGCSLRKATRLSPLLPLIFSLAVLGMFAGCNGSAQPLRATGAVPVRPVRVKLLEDIKLMEVRVLGAYIVTDQQDNVLRQFSSGGLLKIRRDDNGILLNGRLLTRKDLYIKPTSSDLIQVAGRKYRGYLQMSMNQHGSLLAINHVPLEPYIASVLGGELPAYVHAQTFRAQAVAARSYVLHRMLNTTRRDWDVSAGPASQVYGGVNAETKQTKKAQSKTRGQVLVYRSGGQQEVLCAFYSSTCGGGTQAAWELKKGFPHIDPLAGVKINLCQASPRYTWKTLAWKKTDLRRALIKKFGHKNAHLGKLGPIKTLRVSRRTTDKNRAKQISIVDKRGRKALVSGEELRLALKLPSTWFRIEDHPEQILFTGGHGWGHGMGMCQFGAEGMARLKYDYQKILATYYPSSELVRFY